MDLQHKSSTKLSGPRACGPRACGPRAYPSLARGYGPGLGLKLAGRAGPETNIHGLGLGRAWAGPRPKF